MKAIILAAGVSRRLYPLTYEIPKCLIAVGDSTIIDRQLKTLQSLNINEVIIVVGYYRELIIDHVKNHFPDLTFKFVINHHYFETNTAYSLYLGRKVLDSDLMLMNADVIYPIDLLKKIFLSDYETALAVDIKSCGQEEVKVIDGGNNKIVAIGKKLIEEQCLGEFIGVAKLSLDFNYHFSQALSDLIKAGGNDNYFEAAIHLLLDKTDIRYVDVSEYPCLEIDFIEDLNSARKLF